MSIHNICCFFVLFFYYGEIRTYFLFVIEKKNNKKTPCLELILTPCTTWRYFFVKLIHYQHQNDDAQSVKRTLTAYAAAKTQLNLHIRKACIKHSGGFTFYHTSEIRTSI